MVPWLGQEAPKECLSQIRPRETILFVVFDGRLHCSSWILVWEVQSHLSKLFILLNTKNAKTTEQIHTFVALNMPHTFTAHKPLVSEPSLSVTSECQCVGTATACNESRAQTWLSCSVSETKRKKEWMWGSVKTANASPSELYSHCPCLGCISWCVSDGPKASPLACHCKTWERTVQATATPHTWTSCLQQHRNHHPLNETVPFRTEVKRVGTQDNTFSQVYCRYQKEVQILD